MHKSARHECIKQGINLSWNIFAYAFPGHHLHRIHIGLFFLFRSLRFLFLTFVSFRRSEATRYFCSCMYRISRAYRRPYLRRSYATNGSLQNIESRRFYPRRLYMRRSFDNLLDIRFAKLIGTLVSLRSGVFHRVGNRLGSRFKRDMHLASDKCNFLPFLWLNLTLASVQAWRNIRSNDIISREDSFLKGTPLCTLSIEWVPASRQIST